MKKTVVELQNASPLPKTGIQNTGKLIGRNSFLKIIGRAGLFVSLSIVPFALGSRVVYGKDCKACPGKGLCSGNTDCESYRKNKDNNTGFSKAAGNERKQY